MVEEVDCDQHCGHFYSHDLRLSSVNIQHNSVANCHRVRFCRNRYLDGCDFLRVWDRSPSSTSRSSEIQGRMVSEASAIPTYVRQPSRNRSCTHYGSRSGTDRIELCNRPDNLGYLAR